MEQNWQELSGMYRVFALTQFIQYWNEMSTWRGEQVMMLKGNSKVPAAASGTN